MARKERLVNLVTANEYQSLYRFGAHIASWVHRQRFGAICQRILILSGLQLVVPLICHLSKCTVSYTQHEIEKKTFEPLVDWRASTLAIIAQIFGWRSSWKKINYEQKRHKKATSTVKMVQPRHSESNGTFFSTVQNVLYPRDSDS